MSKSKSISKSIPMPAHPDSFSAAKLRLVFAGTPEFAAISLQALIEQQDALNIDIVAVYTQPDRKAGRGQKVSASAVKQLAVDNGIAVEQPLTFRRSDAQGQVSRETLSSYHPDVMVVAAYGLILPLGVLNTPTYGCLNIHASLLPRWRGAAPIHRALLAGDDTTGITIMQMDKGLDTGDMLFKIDCAITAEATSESLHDKLALLGATAIAKVLKDLPSYQAQAEKQDDNLATYAEKLSKVEGEIDWNQSAAAIERQIRGMYPYPGAYTFLASAIGKSKNAQSNDTQPKRIKVLAALPVDPRQTTIEIPGTIISVAKHAILVACGKDKSNDKVATTLRLTRLQFAGSKPVSAEQIYQGKQINDGNCFVAQS